jgi:hypothetical protein
VTDAPTVELLTWISERRRTYGETIEAWRSHCPRLTVWEDALVAGLVCVVRDEVVLTPLGRTALEGRKRQTAPVVESHEYLSPR